MKEVMQKEEHGRSEEELWEERDRWGDAWLVN
jgi:hypothetical protein